MHESRDSIVAAFNWVTKEGVLAEEPLRGARFNIIDAVLHSDAIHRGGGQLIPCARRVLYASQLTASPGLMEPVYQVEISCPTTAMGGVYSTLSHKRGTIVDTTQRGSLATVRGYLPVIECFGFAKILRENTSGQAFMQCFFDHWKLVEGDAMETGSKANEVLMGIRKRKGLPLQVPELSRYLDTL
jgi:elongation factor 2